MVRNDWYYQLPSLIYVHLPLFIDTFLILKLTSRNILELRFAVANSNQRMCVSVFCTTRINAKLFGFIYQSPTEHGQAQIGFHFRFLNLFSLHIDLSWTCSRTTETSVTESIRALNDFLPNLTVIKLNKYQLTIYTCPYIFIAFRGDNSNSWSYPFSDTLLRAVCSHGTSFLQFQHFVTISVALYKLNASLFCNKAPSTPGPAKSFTFPILYLNMYSAPLSVWNFQII